MRDRDILMENIFIYMYDKYLLRMGMMLNFVHSQAQHTDRHEYKYTCFIQYKKDNKNP